MDDVNQAVAAIAAQRAIISPQRAVLVAISGIDGSGKGYITAQIAAQLAQQGMTPAVVHLDGWLNLPDQRFCDTDPAEHFYHHAFRFEALFTQLVMPLKAQRSLTLTADYVEETDTEYRSHTYRFEAIEVILLEGIFLLKRQFQPDYDLSFWIECSFETALERAIARSQEGLSPEETAKAYHRIYFPAQRLHFARDRPQSAATAIIDNDKKTGGS